MGNGPSKTWLLGNSLVTITTSGTGGGSNGVCPRCKVLQRSLQPNPDVLLASNESFLPTSRRLSVSSEGGVDAGLDTGPPLCSCWCRGWSEIKVRRPTGNVAWLMRVQNKLDILATADSNAEYDWSLMGVNTMTLDDNDLKEMDNINDEWDVVNVSNEEGELITTQSHDQSHDVKDMSRDMKDESHDQSLDSDAKSLDQQNKLFDQQNQSHDDLDKSHNQSHDQSIESHDQTDKSHDQLSKSHDQLNKSHDQDSTSKEVRFQRIIAIKQASISSRQPSSYSWSEGGKIDKEEKHGDIVVPKSRDHSTRSYSFGTCSSSIELLPPLFSYDEGNPMSRSPSLIRDDGVLSDPEQVTRLTINSIRIKN